MNHNEILIQKFYTAFAALDFKTMQDCYADDPVFNDPVFGILQGEQVRYMWKMLCGNAKSFTLTFDGIECDGEYCTCNWKAGYDFSKTGRHVVNNVKAHMRIQNGRITEHTDEFDIYKWSRQALGFAGVVLGWSGYLKNKIRSRAGKDLERFMQINAGK